MDTLTVGALRASMTDQTAATSRESAIASDIGPVRDRCCVAAMRWRAQATGLLAGGAAEGLMPIGGGEYGGRACGRAGG
jgi:hypothetical protein